MRSIYLEPMESPSIEESTLVYVPDTNPAWMTPIVNYLRNGILPTDRAEARKLRGDLPASRD